MLTVSLHSKAMLFSKILKLKSLSEGNMLNKQMHLNGYTSLPSGNISHPNVVRTGLCLHWPYTLHAKGMQAEANAKMYQGNKK